MRCKQYQMLVFDYIDDTLGDRQKALLDAHMEKCRDCRDYMAFEQQMRRIFPEAMAERLNELTLSPEVRRNVINAVKPAAENRLWSWIGIPHPVWGLAAGIMLAFISASLYWTVSVRQKQVTVVQSVAAESPPPAPESYTISDEPEEKIDLSYRMQQAFILGNEQAEDMYAMQKDYGEGLDYEAKTPYWEGRGPGNAHNDIPDSDIECPDDPDSAGLNNRLNISA